MPSPRRAVSSSVAATVVTVVRTRSMALSKPRPSAAASISVFDGTQPVNVQSPPGGPSVTSSVRAPAATALRAALSPAAPPPSTITS